MLDKQGNIKEDNIHGGNNCNNKRREENKVSILMFYRVPALYSYPEGFHMKGRINIIQKIHEGRITYYKTF